MSGDSASVLIIDDEPQIRKFLRISLASQGYRVLESTDGRDGLARAALEQPDLVVLDLGLPDMDGQDVLGELRSWTRVPVIVLSVRSSEAEKVRALDAGANDYVTKPFGIQEFLARVRALLRLPQSTTNSPGQVLCGALCIDLAFRRVSLGERMVSLPRTEYAVLAELARHAGRVVTQQHLLKIVWGPSHAGDSHYLRVVIGHLRQKLGDDPAAPRFIVTEAGSRPRPR